MRSVGLRLSFKVVPQFVQKPILVQLSPLGVCVLESYHAPGFLPSVLRHDFAKFILVIDGYGKLETKEASFLMKRDVLFHVPPNISHKIEDIDAPVSLYAIAYRPKMVPHSLFKEISKKKILCQELTGSMGHMANFFRSDIREMLFEQDGKYSGWEVIMLSRLGDFLVRTIRMVTKSKDHSTITFGKNLPSSQRVSAYALRLESRFFMKETLNDAAQATGLSRRRFTELFRKVTGQSWLGKIQDLRLSHAKKLLIQTDKPIIAIAFECGFDDLSNFHHVFKRSMGCAPLAFRKKRKK